MFNGGKFNGDEANIVGTVTADTLNGTTTIISPLFNGGKFNGDEVNVVDASVTNLTAIEINSTNGTYTNQVEAAVFNGGIFNGDTGIISGTLTANTVNAENLNVNLSLSAPIINGTNTIVSPLFNGWQV